MKHQQVQSSTRLVLPGEASRVLIYGVTGSGKTSLALRLGELTGLPVHLADEETGWLPGEVAPWTERSDAQKREIAGRIIAKDSWILDSAYSQFRHAALERVQLILGLDYPRWLSLWRLTRRSVQRVVRREDICHGNIESWQKLLSRESILIWHMKSFRKKRRVMRELAHAHERAETRFSVLLFRSPKALESWLASLPDAK